MTHLQITMACIWTGLVLTFVYAIGEQLNSGLELVIGFITVVATYACVGALLYYTVMAIIGH